MMRGALAILPLVMIVVGAVAAPRDDSIFQASRAASRLMAVSRICPPIIPTDAAKARKFVEAYMAAGRKFAGPEWESIIRSEVERRLAEVEITGEQRWCEDQRRYFREIGVRELFPR